MKEDKEDKKIENKKQETKKTETKKKETKTVEKKEKEINNIKEEKKDETNKNEKDNKDKKEETSEQSKDNEKIDDKEIKEQKEESKKEIEETDNSQELKMGFLKKVWYSITKIERYPGMAAMGLKKALGYMTKIVSIMAIVLCLGIIYKTHNIVQEGVQYLQNEFPEFTYTDGSLNVESDKEIVISEEDSIAGKTIIDTEVQDEQKINQYLNSISEAGEGLIVLKDKVLIKNSSVAGTITYTYKDTFEPLGVDNFDKKDVIEFAKSNKMISLYISLFLTIFIYAFIMYFLTTISNAVILSFFGYITTLLARIRMRYVAVFNMSVYALTLSIILNILYLVVNIFIPFTMQYFQVMYVAVATIYLVAAILILKTEFIKKQAELMKIAEAEEIIKKQMEEKDVKNREEQEKEERRKKDKEDQKKTKRENKKDQKGKEESGEEPEGSNA